MRTVLVFFILLSQTAFSQKKLEVFNKSLGLAQAKAFDAAASSFIKFLELNYPDEPSLAQRNAQYLRELKNPEENTQRIWKFPKDLDLLKALWDTTELRKEIRLWPNEKYLAQHYIDPTYNDADWDSIYEVEKNPINT